MKTYFPKAALPMLLGLALTGGLHRAANESGPTRGPWHIFPGLGCP